MLSFQFIQKQPEMASFHQWLTGVSSYNSLYNGLERSHRGAKPSLEKPLARPLLHGRSFLVTFKRKNHGIDFLFGTVSPTWKVLKLCPFFEKCEGEHVDATNVFLFVSFSVANPFENILSHRRCCPNFSCMIYRDHHVAKEHKAHRGRKKCPKDSCCSGVSCSDLTLRMLLGKHASDIWLSLRSAWVCTSRRFHVGGTAAVVPARGHLGRICSGRPGLVLYQLVVLVAVLELVSNLCTDEALRNTTVRWGVWLERHNR